MEPEKHRTVGPCSLYLSLQKQALRFWSTIIHLGVVLVPIAGLLPALADTGDQRCLARDSSLLTGSRRPCFAKPSSNSYFWLLLAMKGHVCKMEELLTPVKTVTRDDQSLLRPSDEQKNNAKNTETEPKSQPDGDPSSPDYILGILRSKPDRDQLYEVLHTLDPANKAVANRVFDIRVPGPTTAQILQILVSTTIPDHWNSLEADSGSQASQGQKRKDPKLRGVLLRCLSSVAGISSLVSQLRTLLATHNSVPEHDNGSGRHLVIRDILAVLSALLKPEDFLVRLYTDICALHGNATQQQVAWRELISLVAAGRVLSTAAEALTSIKDLDNLKSISWVGEGASYASWLGRNIRHMATKIDTNNQEAYKSVALITGRAMSLGYIGNIEPLDTLFRLYSNP